LLWHLIDLKRKAHSCADFQKESNESGVVGFSAIVIDYGDKWQKVGDRLEQELRLCKIIGLKNVYNFDQEKRKTPFFHKSYQYDGKVFVSIESLRASINKQGKNNGSLLRPYSEASFRRQFLYLDSPRRNEIVFIEKTKVVNQFQQYKVYG
jgi:hypothetical protein